MPRLFVAHARGLAASFADLENHAAAQDAAPLATPGSVLERTNAGGFRFYAVQSYDHEGRRGERYLGGPVGDAAADRLAERARSAIAEAREAMASIRLLLREGYPGMPPKPFAIVAALANQGVFAAGAVLIGTHAFDAIVNRLSVRASAFGTEDIDIARPAALALPRESPGLLDMLRASGIEMAEVPAFDPGKGTGKYKEAGRSRFTLDLMVPGRGREAGVAYLPELKAHAVSLPFLAYLLAESQPGTVLSRFGCAAVRLPVPERYAMHKMLVSRLRSSGSGKRVKDLRQASILAAVLSEQQPGALAAAFEALPAAAKGAVREAIRLSLPELHAHPQAVDELEALS